MVFIRSFLTNTESISWGFAIVEIEKRFQGGEFHRLCHVSRKTLPKAHGTRLGLFHGRLLLTNTWKMICD
ncbi:hypothetical protein ABKN59_010960 [Abortiporus biennis]